MFSPRALLAWCASAALAIVATPFFAQAQPTSLTGAYSEYEMLAIRDAEKSLHTRLDSSPEGKTIERIDFVRLDPIDEHDPLPTALDSLHTASKEYVVRRALLVAEGQPWRSVIVDESARNLRRRRQLSLVVCVPVVGSAKDRVRLVVITKDVWSLYDTRAPSSPRSSSSAAPRLTSSAKVRLSEIVAPLVMSSVFVSIVLFVFAAKAYPGGTHFDHFAVGHDFWRNTLCDVARSTALGGASNAVGASLARTAMTIMAIGVGGLFLLLPDRFPSSPRIGVVVRVLGCIAVSGAIAVVFLPTDRFGVLHGIAIVVAGIPGIGAAVLATVGLLREPSSTRPRWITAIGVVALTIAMADFVLYVHELVTQGSASLAVSVLERLAALFVLAWMLAVARRCRSEEVSSDERW